MIRPLRRRHPWMIGAVALVAGPLFLAALAVRPDFPVQEELPAGLDGPAATVVGDGVGVGVGVELATTPPIRLQPLPAGGVEATAEAPVEGADLLLYWAPAVGSREPADAYLLGALRGGERQLFHLPEAAAEKPGVLILYSLGHGEEVAYTPWPPATQGPAPQGPADPEGRR